MSWLKVFTKTKERLLSISKRCHLMPHLHFMGKGFILILIAYFLKERMTFALIASLLRIANLTVFRKRGWKGLMTRQIITVSDFSRLISGVKCHQSRILSRRFIVRVFKWRCSLYSSETICLPFSVIKRSVQSTRQMHDVTKYAVLSKCGLISIFIYL